MKNDHTVDALRLSLTLNTDKLEGTRRGRLDGPIFTEGEMSTIRILSSNPEANVLIQASSSTPRAKPECPLCENGHKPSIKKLLADASILPLVGRDFADLEYSMLPQVQVRTHRKKRINKKWLKKYGTKVVYKHMPTWLTHTYSPADVTFSREYLGRWATNTEDALLHGVKENYSISALVEEHTPTYKVRPEDIFDGE